MGRCGFWEGDISGYQWCDRKVSWRKERSGLREHGSDNGLGRVKRKKKTGNSHLLQEKRRKQGKRIKWVNTQLTSREDVG